MNSGQVAPDDQSIAQLNTNHEALFGGFTAEILTVLLQPWMRSVR